MKKEIEVEVRGEIIAWAVRHAKRSTYPVSIRDRFKLAYGARRLDYNHPQTDPYPYPIELVSGCGHVG